MQYIAMTTNVHTGVAMLND